MLISTQTSDLPETFNPELYFTALSGSASLPDLLQRENELLMGTISYFFPFVLSLREYEQRFENWMENDSR